MKNFRWTIMAAALLVSNGVVHAQGAAPLQAQPMSVPSAANGPSPSPLSTSGGVSGGSGTGSTGGTTTASNADSGNITNLGPDPSIEQTLPVQRTSSAGIGPGKASATVDSEPVPLPAGTTQVENGALIDTGGQPLLVTMFGLCIAAGAFFARRRITA